MREEVWSEGGGEMLGGEEREGAGQEVGPVFSDGEGRAESR